MLIEDRVHECYYCGGSVDIYDADIDLYFCLECHATHSGMSLNCGGAIILKEEE